MQIFDDSDGIFSFLVAKFFVYFWKNTRFVYFSKSEPKKNLATKKLKLPSESLDNFASCYAAIFKLRKISLFF